MSYLFSIGRNNVRTNYVTNLISSSLWKFKLKRNCDDHSKKVKTIALKSKYLMFADICFHLNTLQVDFFIVTAAFVNLRNSHHKIKSQNNLQLANGVPTHMFYSQEQYGGTQNGIEVTNELFLEVFAQSGLSIDNGSTAFNFMDEEFLRNCEHFLPDPIEIPSNEKIEAYPFLKYKLRI